MKRHKSGDCSGILTKVVFLKRVTSNTAPSRLVMWLQVLQWHDMFNENPEFRSNDWSESYAQSNINTYFFPTRPLRLTVHKSQGKSCDGNTACVNTQRAKCHYTQKRTHLSQIKHTTSTEKEAERELSELRNRKHGSTNDSEKEAASSLTCD